ncbi:MAG: MBL fold metallo-hydrolase [Rhizobiales bacterium]|nr:MBL fold metallo-hydrolase [Hyphomicrobiales bacterium]
MAEETLKIHFWGVRGSVPVSGAEYGAYGGNTACIELTCGGRTLILDAGSGLRQAGEALTASGVAEADIFLTHSHYDHVIGLPFFTPLYDPKIRITLWCGHMSGRMTARELLGAFMSPPWFPVEVDSCTANLAYRDFVPGDVLAPAEDIAVRTAPLNHPGGCVGYRVEWAGRAVALVSDTEHMPGTLDPVILDFIRGADLVIYDTTYTDAEMQRFRGFGHSSWQQGIRLCEAAGAKRLALFHHDPARTDAQLAAIERDARERFAGAFAARDGLTLEL